MYGRLLYLLIQMWFCVKFWNIFQDFFHISTKLYLFYFYDILYSSVSGGGESYTTKLRDSPRSSPVRGGSNLKRSHSAFNLSQVVRFIKVVTV